MPKDYWNKGANHLRKQRKCDFVYWNKYIFWITETRGFWSKFLILYLIPPNSFPRKHWKIKNVRNKMNARMLYLEINRNGEMNKIYGKWNPSLIYIQSWFSVGVSPVSKIQSRKTGYNFIEFNKRDRAIEDLLPEEQLCFGTYSQNAPRENPILIW